LSCRSWDMSYVCDIERFIIGSISGTILVGLCQEVHTNCKPCAIPTVLSEVGSASLQNVLSNLIRRLIVCTRTLYVYCSYSQASYARRHNPGRTVY
jgi:hypothetical protein